MNRASGKLTTASAPDSSASRTRFAAAKQSGTRFGRPPVDPAVIAEKLDIAQDARRKGRTAAEAASLVGWSRATLYRHQQAARALEALEP